MQGSCDYAIRAIHILAIRRDFFYGMLDTSCSSYSFIPGISRVLTYFDNFRR